MTERLPYYPIWLNDLALALSRLSKPHGTSAYLALWFEYHCSRGLPAVESEVRKIAGFTGNKKWDGVRKELFAAGFTKEWRNPKWDESAAKAEARYTRGHNGGKKKEANRAEADLDVDYEREIPF
jgi:uncharacterized protein YdaU (DUF1376 family)